jgi:transposase
VERGRFVWPRTEGEAVTITPAQLRYLLEGIELAIAAAVMAA